MEAKSGGMGLCGWLTVVFVTLKLLGKISWPWIWVLAPTWIPLAIVTAILAVVAIVGAAVIIKGAK